MLKRANLYIALFFMIAVFVIFAGCSEDETEAPVPDTTPPTVLASEPVNNDVDVSRSGPFWILFSETMNEESVEDSLSLFTTGSISIGFGTYWHGDSLFVSPYSLLGGGAGYIITVSGSSKDLAGNQLGDDYVVNFTTTSEEDITPPTVISTIPEDDAMDVTPVITIEITFSEPIFIPSFDWYTQTFFTLNPPLSDGSISIDGPTLFLEDLVFPQNTEVEVTLTTDITDLAGNPMAANYNLSFTTLSDNIRPTLVSATPSNGTTGISPNISQMVFNFSEPMNPY
ncbi:Ig-like domain-containing protein, partial [bacterium]|nr:Ig-like domain-containing protein [bacterium]